MSEFHPEIARVLIALISLGTLTLLTAALFGLGWGVWRNGGVYVSSAIAGGTTFWMTGGAILSTWASPHARLHSADLSGSLFLASLFPLCLIGALLAWRATTLVPTRWRPMLVVIGPLGMGLSTVLLAGIALGQFPWLIVLVCVSLAIQWMAVEQLDYLVAPSQPIDTVKRSGWLAGFGNDPDFGAGTGWKTQESRQVELELPDRKPQLPGRKALELIREKARSRRNRLQKSAKKET